MSLTSLHFLRAVRVCGASMVGAPLLTSQGNVSGVSSAGGDTRSDCQTGQHNYKINDDYA
jgi:hypothetical protein